MRFDQRWVCEAHCRYFASSPGQVHNGTSRSGCNSASLRASEFCIATLDPNSTCSRSASGNGASVGNPAWSAAARSNAANRSRCASLIARCRCASMSPAKPPSLTRSASRARCVSTAPHAAQAWCRRGASAPRAWHRTRQESRRRQPDVAFQRGKTLVTGSIRRRIHAIQGEDHLVRIGRTGGLLP